jgi:hypothetical protein
MIPLSGFLCALWGSAFRGLVLINQFQRKLNLSRSPRRFVDNPEPAPTHHIVWQSEIYDIENIEKLRSELQDAQFILAAAAE